MLSNLILKRKTLLSMLFIGLCLLGYISYRQLPVELLPAAELPFLVVQVNSVQELSPEYMEKQAIIPVEGAIGTLEDIEKIESYAYRRRGVIFIYYTQSANIKYAYLKLQQKVDAVKADLDDEFLINVFKIDTEQISNMFMDLQVRGTGGVDRIRHIVDEKIAMDLQNIDGIANVQISGGREQSVEIILDQQACQAHHITAGQIRTIVAQYGGSKEFLGHVHEKDKQYFVNLVTEYVDVQELENIVIKQDGPVLLKHVAEVYQGVKEETSISRVNGKETVTIQLIRDSQANLIALSHETRQVIADLNQKIVSGGVEIVIQNDAAEEMERNIDLIKQLALVGGLLAIVILWYFLRHFQLVIVIALAIPISILTAMNFFYAAGITINSLTLVGAALAIGMLLDNSIVVLENIYRLYSSKEDSDKAVVRGTKEVWRSIFAATFTTIAIFLPFLFASNFFVKLIGKQIGVSIISTLLVSLVVALLLIPAFTHRFLTSRLSVRSVNFNIVSQKNRLLQIYTLLLKSTMRFPVRTIVAGVVLFFVSLIICMALSINVSQEVETEDFRLYVTMQRGATLSATDKVVADVEEKLSDLEEKQDVVTQIFEEDAIITIKLKEDFEAVKNRDLAEVKGEIKKRIKNIRSAQISFDQPMASERFRGGGRRNPGADFMNILGIGSQKEKIVIKGRNFRLMKNIAEDFQYYLEDLATIDRVSLDVADDRPEIHLLLDNQILSHYDIPLMSIASELSGFESEFSSGMTFKSGTREYDIVIRNSNLEEKQIDDLRDLQIRSNTSSIYPLDQLSRIIYSSGISRINRVNQEKQIEVTFTFLNEVNNSKRLLKAARSELDQLISQVEIPAGIAVEIVQEETDLTEYKFLFLAAFIFIYMILASVFESFLIPLVMMFAIPLAVIGSLWAIILTGNSLLNANTLTGFLILLGVVVNNGIILIDYTRILRRRGFSVGRALIAAGQTRVRPILITTITTIVALIPLAMGKAEYVVRIGAPFAITVIGGLAVGMLFTLVFIPTTYIGLETALAWFKKLNRKIKMIQMCLLVAGTVLIYQTVDSLVWQLANGMLLIFVIPGATYFIMTSLRRANVKWISADEPLTIKLKYVVKIYDDSSRFVREWHKKDRQSARTGEDINKFSLKNLTWQLPVFAYLTYFSYFYLENGLWLFLLSHIVYLFGFFILNLLLSVFQYAKWQKWIYKIYVGGVPLIHLILFYIRWEKIVTVVFIAVFWGTLLAVYTTSNRIHNQNINIVRIKGRFVSLRKLFYRFVMMIPVIGKKKKPFRALDGVSMEIGSGMFGLLGPNGAGKTTLMRIISGILEQSRGTIKINDIDLKEKREELQGLIGYLPQEFGSYENMTAYEFLDYQAMLKNILDPDERLKTVEAALSSVHLDDHRNSKIGSFSGGMKQRIGIAQTLLHLPRIMVVDEPTAGLDPRERIRFRNLLVDLSKDRIVIFSTHIIEDISSSCDKVAVLNKGKLCFLGAPGQMVAATRGYVWQSHLLPDEFENVRHKLWLVHHVLIGDSIRIRFLAEKSILSDAVQVRPTLEDAYLWLLGRD